MVADRERGGVTAELAVGIPAVVLVLGLCLAALQVAGLQVRLQDAAAVAARSLGRAGDVPDLGPGLADAAVVATRRGPLVCARVSMPASGAAGELLGLRLHAESCALSEQGGPGADGAGADGAGADGAGADGAGADGG